MRLTELEKTVMLVFLVFTKGSPDKYLEEKLITSKFTTRKRVMVRRSLKRLAKEGLLLKHPEKASYKLSKKGLKSASKLLHEGVKLWKVY